MNRVLVTGASGFIGRALLPVLQARGYEVHGCGRGAAPSGLSDIAAWHTADLLTERGRARVISTVRPSHLVHLAWEARPGRYRDHPDNAAWTTASLDLLQQAIAAGANRIVGIGTCFEYGSSTTPCREDVTACRPTTLYGQAKLAAAEGFVAAAQRGAGVAWGRVFFPFGEGEAEGRLIPSLIRSLRAGEVFNCSLGTQVRDFIHVGDLAQAIAAVLDGDVTGVVNLGSGEPRTLRSVVEFFARRLEAEHLVAFGAREVSGVDAEPVIVADIARLKSTGWQPTIGFEAGAVRTLAWWQERLSSGTS
jgi:nucleoside-diphosphate-sugar epimerase